MKFVALRNNVTISLTAAICVDGILDPNPNWFQQLDTAELSIIAGGNLIQSHSRGSRLFNGNGFTRTGVDKTHNPRLNNYDRVSIKCRLKYRAGANHIALIKIGQAQKPDVGMTDLQLYTPSPTRNEGERGQVNAVKETERPDSDGTTQSNPQASHIPHFEFKSPSEAPYKFISEFGAGSSSRVDEVQHKITEKRYARKSIRCNASEADTVREIIIREVGVVQRLSHDHIVSVHCSYREPRSFNILITPVAEGDLTWYLDKVSDENYPESDLKLMRTWFACLARGLAYVHENKIRHKDIKPANILVKGSIVLLTDSGIAQDFISEFTSSIQNGYSAKTLMYCAPEVADDDGQRSRSADVVSLGYVFAEMATVLVKKSVAEFYKMRRIGKSHAYFCTLDLVQSWMANHAVLPYSRFIALMLSPNRVARPSAALVELLIQTGGLDGKEGISCTHG